MQDLRAELASRIQQFSPQDGLHEAPLTGVHCIKLSHPTLRIQRHWRATLAIVAQGRKEIGLDRAVYRFEEAHYIASLIDLPVSSQVIKASAERPFLCLRMDFDPLLVSEMAARLDAGDTPTPSSHAIFVGKAPDSMLEAAIRLVGHFGRPQDARVLGPLVIRELYYHLLQGPDGAAIRQFVRAGSQMHAIYSTLYQLRTRLDQDFDIDSLAQDASMSRSVFFKQFKQATSMSPIQYQKRLRLLEARRLMIEAGETAERSAFQVGYRSASQFSREYSRLFGDAPLRDAQQLKQSGEALADS